MPHLLMLSKCVSTARSNSALLSLLLALPLAAIGPALFAQPRGYQPRACGFDMDDDGIIGEPEDCNVCDGVTTDPDGDGVAEDLVYVSSASGADTATCGSPGSPCRTINYAIESSSRSDGPGDGAEEIYCLAGTFREGDIDPLFNGGGVAGTTSIPATGSQERAWEKSRNPVMLVGWDADNDGEYPPYDTDDTCVIDGTGTSLTHALRLSQGSHAEIAHCSYRDFGADYAATDDTSTGFLVGDSGKHFSHLSMHDLSLVSINDSRGSFSGVIVWNQFGGYWKWAEMRNLEILDSGAYLSRGSADYGAGAEEEGPIRWQNVTARFRGCGNVTCDYTRARATVMKTWGFYTGIELIDSVWDFNPDGWTGGAPAGGGGPVMEACNRDVVFRNNEFLDFFVAIRVYPHQSDSYCGGSNARTASGLVVDRNYIRNEFDYDYQLGEGAVQILPGGESPGEQFTDLTVTNNVVTCSANRYEYFADDRSGHSIGGAPAPVIIYDHNTLACNFTRDTTAVFELGNANNSTHANWTISNNLVQGLEVTDDLTDIIAGSVTWIANRYNNGDSVASSGWTRCNAAFLADGYHLSPSDTCAVGKASNSRVVRDYDGDLRTGSFDVGADQVEGTGGGGDVTPGTVRFSASSYSGSEGQSMTVTVQRANGSDGSGSVRVVAVSGSASSGSDFGALSQTLSWASGDSTSRTVSIQLLADQAVEGSESFTVRLENASGVSLGSPSSATVTITDATTQPVPGSLRFGSSTFSGNEGGTVAVTVQRVDGSDGAASVQVVTQSGTAVSGSDFGAVSQTLSWADGDATSRTVSVQLLADQTVESTESFTVLLQNATGASLGSPSSATVTIADATQGPGPAGSVRFSSSALSGLEGESVQVIVERVDGSAGAASVRVTTAAGTASAPGDFTAVSQTIAWADGDASPKSVTLQLLADDLVEAQESFSVRLDQATGVALGSPNEASVAIQDTTPNAQPPRGSIIQFEVASVTVPEGKTVRLKLWREGSTDGHVAVRYFTVEGSAKESSDYVAESAEVAWSSGSSSPQQITVGTVDDKVAEPAESFAIALGPPTGGAVLGSRSSVLVTIEDNDAAAPETSSAGVRFVSANHLVGEGDGTLEVLLERVGSSAGPASVDLTTLPGSAEPDRDYVPTTQTVRWNSREGGVKSVSVEILQDALSEGSEDFQLKLVNPWKVAISGSATSTVTIHDDEIASTGSVEVSAEGERPAISAQSGDRLAVLWEEPGAAFQASVQLFDEEGNPIGDKVPLGKEDLTIREPSAAFDRENGLGVVWLESNPVALGNLVVAQRSPADDPAAGERVVLANTAANARDLRVAVDGYGRFLVTWRADGRIHFRAFDSAGVLPLASSISEVVHHQIDVALGGEAVIVLEIAQSIAFQRYDRHGVPVGALTPVTVDVPSYRPDVAVAADGSFVLVWEAETGNPLSGRDVFAQIFDPTGVPAGSIFRVNTMVAGNQGQPRVDANDAGDFAVTWVDDPAAGRVLVRFFDARTAAASGDVLVAETDTVGTPMQPRVAVAEDDDTTVVFSRQDSSGNRSVFFRTFGPELGAGVCVSDQEHLCLGGGRFRVRASWRDRAGVKAPGVGSQLTADTGTFWFLDPANIELVVKTLDGCGVNRRRWVFAGGLTDVEVTLQVTDTRNGDSQTYFNREGRSFVPVRDPEAFVDCDAPSGFELGPDGLLAPDLTAESWAASAPGDCGSANGLCLGNGRFRVEASWNQGAQGGPADSVPLTSDTGYFWFFDQDNVELVVKVLDACGVNGRFWVFGGGLTDVGVKLTVTDTWTGERLDYVSGSGQPFLPILDTRGFGRACAARAP